jgi:two-component system, NtrC family, sensor kinase
VPAWSTAWAAIAVAAAVVALVAVAIAVAVAVAGRRRVRVLEAELGLLRESAREVQQLAAAVRFTADSIEILDTEGRIVYVNPAYENSQGVVLAAVRGRRPEEVESVFVQDGGYYDMLRVSGEEGRVWSGVLKSRLQNGKLLEEQVTVSPIRDARDNITAYVIVKRDVAAIRALEQQLAQAQKLESIGRLAAGIAHEVNTPMHFVADNLCYLRESIAGLLPLLRAMVGPDGSQRARQAGVADLVHSLDLDFLAADIPRAIEQSLEGCDRITHIVKSMKEFSHPGTDTAPTDLNRAIRSTVTVATHEWKPVAQVRLDLDPDLPEIVCNAGEVNQAVLNMLVNAAHAIEAASRQDPSRHGVITIITRRASGGAEVMITDNGTGIPPEISGRVFDPFFTTKPVGRGTGQGLAIAHDVIVRRHGGSLRVDSLVGSGSTFTLWLPCGRVVTDSAPETAHGIAA